MGLNNYAFNGIKMIRTRITKMSSTSTTPHVDEWIVNHETEEELDQWILENIVCKMCKDLLSGAEPTDDDAITMASVWDTHCVAEYMAEEIKDEIKT